MGASKDARGDVSFQSLVENLPDAVWRISPNLHFTYVTPWGVRRLGYEPNQIIGKSIFDFMTPESAAHVRELAAVRAERVRKGERLKQETHEVEQVCKDGRTIWTEVLFTPLYGPEGELAGFQGVARDITERKRTEEALRKNRETLETMFEAAPT